MRSIASEPAAETPPSLLERDGAAIAFHHTAGAEPGVLFCGGFMSDMTGTKATALEAWARVAGVSCTRFDYQGHGASSGRFADGTIGLWADDALAVLDRVATGRTVVVGSSMGGWIALLLALRRPERVAGLVGIAPAPDFTEDLMWNLFDEATRREITGKGAWMRPSEYSDEGQPITRALIEDGRRHLLLRGPIGISAPVRLLHGMRDADVPWGVSLTLADRLAAEDVRVTLVKDGDHRLSRPHDIDLLCRTVAELVRELR